MDDFVEDRLREASNDLDFLRGDATSIRIVDEVFRLAARDCLDGMAPVELTMRAISSLRTALHGKQFTFLPGIILFSRLMFEQECVDLQEEYRIVSGAEVERLQAIEEILSEPMEGA